VLIVATNKVAGIAAAAPWNSARLLKKPLAEKFPKNTEPPLEIQFVTTRNVLRENNGQPTHWMANIFVAKLDPTLVKNGEPEKIEELGWFPFDTLPEPLHSQLTRHFVAARKTVGF